MFVYLGSDTNDALGASNGRGIYCVAVDPGGRALTTPRLCFEGHNVSWLCLHPSLPVLYAAHEVPAAQAIPGRVSSFSIDPASGELTLLNSVSSHGARPVHLSLDARARFAFVANYTDGVVAVFPLDAAGKLQDAVAHQVSAEPPGSSQPSTAPPGSFARSGHDRSHPHMVQMDPSNRWLLHTDLGQDRIYIHSFDTQTGALRQSDVCPFVSLPDGDGPRHIAFHPNGRWLYSLQEEASTIVLFDFDAGAPSLTARQTVSSLPPRFAGTSFASGIALAQNSRHLYAANRLHNSVAVFVVAGDGTLSLRELMPTQGDYPNHFVVDPHGTLMLVCNQRSDNATVFRFDPATGVPAFTGEFIPVGSPSCAVFVDPTSLKR
jgi:6-phosphogluconolactonase